jgi:hypothetical protein
MKRKIYLTETQLNLVVNRIIKENELEEGIFDSISNVYQGIKGFWRGEGYDFFKYLNSLKNMAKDLRKLDQPNVKIMTKLTDLKNKITSSTMPQEKKGQLVFEIDKALKNFEEYSKHIEKLEDVANQRLQGIRTYSEKPEFGLEEPTTQDNKLTQNSIKDIKIPQPPSTEKQIKPMP